MINNEEIYIALVSILVAACALGTTIWQGYIMRKHNKLSVKPLLTTFDLQDLKGNIEWVEYRLENCGVGPAIIKNFSLFYDEKEVSRNNRKTYEDFFKDKTKGFLFSSNGSCVPNSIIPAGGSIVLVSFKYDKEKHDVSFAEKINIVVEYQSIYKTRCLHMIQDNDRHFHCNEVV
jgi:hypothetical protein